MKQVQGEYDGKRIQLIWRNLDPAQPNQVGEQAREFVRGRVDLIVAFEDKSIRSGPGRDGRPGEPDPGRLPAPVGPSPRRPGGSSSHPGGNLTGVWGARDPVAKQLQIYRQIMPGPQPLRLLTLEDPTDTATTPLLTEARTAAGKLGIELDEVEASNDAGLEAAFQSLRQGAVDGAFILSPSLRLNFSRKILGLAAAAYLPSRLTGANGSTRNRSTRRALLAGRRRRARRDRGRAFRRQHPEGRPTRRPARPGVPRVEFASVSGEQRAGDRRAAGRRRAGRPGLPIAEREAGSNGGNAGHGRISASSGSTWPSLGSWSRRRSRRSGSASPTFSYDDSQRAVTEAEADKASSAAISIRQFIQELESDLDAVAQPIPATPRTGARAVIQDLFLRQRAISALTYLDATGRRGVHASPTRSTSIDSLTCGGDRSDSEAFRRARAEQRYFGSVAFSLREWEAAHEHRGGREASPGGGVIVADVDLGSAVDCDPPGADWHRGLRLRRLIPHGQVIAHTNEHLLVLATPTSRRCRRCAPHGTRRHGTQRRGHQRT